MKAGRETKKVRESVGKEIEKNLMGRMENREK